MHPHMQGCFFLEGGDPSEGSVGVPFGPLWFGSVGLPTFAHWRAGRDPSWVPRKSDPICGWVSATSTRDPGAKLGPTGEGHMHDIPILQNNTKHSLIKGLWNFSG